MVETVHDLELRGSKSLPYREGEVKNPADAVKACGRGLSAKRWRCVFHEVKAC